MKKIGTFILLFAFLSTPFFAQEKKEVRIKTIKIVDGKETKVDTVIYIDVEADHEEKIHEILMEFQVDEELDLVKLEKGMKAICIKDFNSSDPEKLEDFEKRFKEVQIKRMKGKDLKKEDLEKLLIEEGELRHKIIRLHEDFQKERKCEKSDTDVEVIVIKAKVNVKVTQLDEEDKAKLKAADITNQNNLELNELNVYPNPSKGAFTIEAESKNDEPIAIDVYNPAGKKVFSDKQKDGKYNKEIELPEDASGLFVHRNTQEGKELTKKVIVE